MAQNKGTKNTELITFTGEVLEALPNTMFRVEVQEGPAELLGKKVLCTLTGKMRRYRIRVLPGDPVTAEMSLYDLGRARITRRLRDSQAPDYNEDEQEDNKDQVEKDQ